MGLVRNQPTWPTAAAAGDVLEQDAAGSFECLQLKCNDTPDR